MPGSQRGFPCRFNTSVQFGLPDESCRAQILHQYAKHLSDKEVVSVAAASVGMAGRDLKDLSEQAERRWASKVGTCNPLLLQLYCCQHSSSRSVLLYPDACLSQVTSQVTTSLKIQANCHITWSGSELMWTICKTIQSNARQSVVFALSCHRW